MANGASVNVLRAPHCSETDARFQPACAFDRPPDDPRGGGWEYTGDGSRDNRPGGGMTTNPEALESAALRIGQHLAQLSAGRIPTVFDSRWWSQSVINLAMKDPAFKVQLFRFIDVLPAVASV